ncbi:MAG: ribonuclease HIII [Bacilli bacterium]
MNLVLKVSDETKEKMIKYYEDKKRPKEIPYVVFQADEEDTVITMYNSNKVMFQGVSADVDANLWKEIDKSDYLTKDKKDKIKDETNYSKYYYSSSVGSDEVGTGDYFGPIVVTASYVKKEDISYLEEIGLKDSKKLTDDKILKIAPLIAKRIKYKTIILSNTEYNQKYSLDTNMNKIKAIMHNKVLNDLTSELTEHYDYIIVDQFAKEYVYYNYLKDTNIKRGITFLTKGEDKNLAVAASSVISRYLFIKEFDKLSDSLHIPLLKGASDLVDKVGLEVVKQYGLDKLKDVSKYNFKNTQKIKDLM